VNQHPKLTELREKLRYEEEGSLQDFLKKPQQTKIGTQRVPPWVKLKIPSGRAFQNIKQDIEGKKLATVCEEAKCPNIGECWSGREGTATATIMIMGEECTRGCRFCSVKTSRKPAPLDPDEPMNTALAIENWKVDYIVITTVDRDDLSDGGANHFAKTVQLVKEKSPNIFIECLTGDFGGNLECVSLMTKSPLDVYAHNVETVEALQRWVRDHRAGYKQSLSVLEHAKKTRPGLITKSSLMLGHGETDDQVRQTLKDLLNIGVDCITIGQYLQPSKKNMRVAEFVHPEIFKYWEQEGLSMGFKYVASGPMVRSSYRAGEYFLTNILKQQQKTKETPKEKVLIL
jgi:lipoic acid synthetase